ncbi:serine hydrolase [Mucilaginibacter sp. PPCGB 2223]|uniref:serine hydrolase domain-containing protein n=1 Tax=Mucilaginibacter sp. PPCGB 2223 TaxID=1886027 RepID=UPI0008250463|nr:serine hydrolase domain-containing protein [Mucilaginibacter sp. PPCGB 2223]OCX53364.1 serine hydrolase [Mucilaginibacter sp. PPCGB 2223]
MKKRLACLLVLLAITLYTRAQNRFAKVDAWLAANTQQMGGRAILLIFKDGHIVYTGAKSDMSGMQKMFAQMVAKRTGKPANLQDYTSTTQQPIASCSKWLSAALVMTFVEEGKLKLDDTVGKYLPVLTTAGKGSITLEQCLSHRTGIKAPSLMDDLAEMRKEQNMDDAIKDIAAMPIEGKPGTVFRYSNVGLQIAGAILEKISGKPFEELFEQCIAKPLGMKNSDFGHAKVALPAGGGNSTPEDYINFLTMILNKGMFNGKRILSEKSIQLMQVDRIALNNTKVAYSPAEAGDVGYGFGEWVNKGASLTSPAVMVSSPGLFGSYPLIDNQRHYAAFLMTYYLRAEGKQKRYTELKQLIDEALQ